VGGRSLNNGFSKSCVRKTILKAPIGKKKPYGEGGVLVVWRFGQGPTTVGDGPNVMTPKGLKGLGGRI